METRPPIVGLFVLGGEVGWGEFAGVDGAEFFEGVAHVGEGEAVFAGEFGLLAFAVGGSAPLPLLTLRVLFCRSKIRVRGESRPVGPWRVWDGHRGLTGRGYPKLRPIRAVRRDRLFCSWGGDPALALRGLPN